MVREARPATRFWTRGDFGTTLVRWALLLAAITVILGGLRYASVVAIPIVLGILFAMLLAPLHLAIARRAPSWLGAAVSGIVAVGAILLIGGAIWWAGDRAWEEYQQNREEYLAEYAEARAWLADRGLPEQWLPEAESLRSATENIEGDSAPAEPNQQQQQAGAQDAQDRTLGEWFWQLPAGTRERLASWATGSVGSLLGGLVLLGFAIGLMILLLYDLDRWREQATASLGDRQDRWLHEWLVDGTRSVRRYFWGKTITGLVSGGLTGLWLWIMGVPIPWVWAILTLLMNYIPNVGAFISGAPPTILALFTGGITNAAIVAVGLVFIEGVVVNLMDPFVQGALLRLSPFMVVVALVFWAWMWGVPGAIISVPLMNMIILAIERLPRYQAEHQAQSESRDGLVHEGG